MRDSLGLKPLVPGIPPIRSRRARAVGDRPTSPSAEVLRTLVAGLVGEVPSAAHRRALEVAAQAHSSTEELLAAVLADQDAPGLFQWLRELPFIESTPLGLYPHDAARETLTADLRWRAPIAFQAMRQRLAEELLASVARSPAGAGACGR
ncbi:hypothetical protein [Streptomyces cavernae]|uniref:hypothetical protein n=1 Tax=Streptomyces cavernae TaxID=2259034 RepID=UPI00192E3D7D|nr:hypothetical protein [Streptomyces cavernae]